MDSMKATEKEIKHLYELFDSGKNENYILLESLLDGYGDTAVEEAKALLQPFRAEFARRENIPLEAILSFYDCSEAKMLGLYIEVGKVIFCENLHEMSMEDIQILWDSWGVLIVRENVMNLMSLIETNLFVRIFRLGIASKILNKIKT